jgi:hypothetical protein
MKNVTKNLVIATMCLLVVCIFCGLAQAQDITQLSKSDKKSVLIEDIVFYVRECSMDSTLVKVPLDYYMVDKNGNHITEYYIPREATLKDFAIWLGKKYYR